MLGIYRNDTGATPLELPEQIIQQGRADALTLMLWMHCQAGQMRSHIGRGADLVADQAILGLHNGGDCRLAESQLQISLGVLPDRDE